MIIIDFRPRQARRNLSTRLMIYKDMETTQNLNALDWLPFKNCHLLRNQYALILFSTNLHGLLQTMYSLGNQNVRELAEIEHP